MSVMDNINMISGQSTLLLAGDLQTYLDHHEIETLFAHNKIIHFSANEIILRQGDKIDGIYIILEGSVTLKAKILGERTTDLEILSPGHFIGEVGYIENISCSTSAISNESVTCLFISDLYFKVLSAYYPEVKYKIFCHMTKQICDHLKKMHDKITHFIENIEMTKRSPFSEIIYSLTKQATIVSQEESHIDVEDFLETPFFQSFNKEDLFDLIKNGTLLKVPKNCTLITNDENKNSCYIVLRGAVQSSIIHQNKVAKLSVIGPAILFASTTFVDRSLAFTVSFATCEQSILMKLSEEQLNFIQKENPNLWYKIFYLVTRSLVALQRSVDKLDIRLSIETIIGK
jgi:CRP/FNR family cyclic AMP-dependent transcriptional regulator